MIHYYWYFTLKKSEAILVGVATTVIASLIISIYTDFGKDYAVIKHQLSASETIFQGGTLKVTLILSNEGNMDYVPTSTVSVSNATIQRVEIKDVQQVQLSKYCSFNDTVACISNLGIEAGMKYPDFIKVYVTPNQDVSSFTVLSDVAVSSNFNHPNKVKSVLPYELIYEATGQGEYVLFD